MDDSNIDCPLGQTQPRSQDLFPGLGAGRGGKGAGNEVGSDSQSVSKWVSKSESEWAERQSI